ncbi:unnamed protein product [Effrenium voratum]|nr:unnamed protein product [Effrenium voratum]
MAAPLPRCDKCDKEFDKLLQCGRCKNAFYCSKECQNTAWKSHKNICRKPNEEPPEAKIHMTRLAQKEAKPKPKSFGYSPPVTVTKEDLEEPETAEQFRQELLREAKVTNAKMMAAMQESGGNSQVFLPQVASLKEAYYSFIMERMCAKDPEREDVHDMAVQYGEGLMREVIFALLQRGLPNSASVDQLDLANNHFRTGIIQQMSPAEFALSDGDLEGFEPAVSRVSQKGFVTVEGLLDAEMAAVIHKECEENFWHHRAVGAMSLAKGEKDGFYECWLPYPPRKGTSPELEHALRILFGLPHEFGRHGYPTKLKTSTMAHLACFPPGSREAKHLDSAGDTTNPRELTYSLFLAHDWKEEDSGQHRIFLDGKEESKPHQDVCPEVGRCLIFQSQTVEHMVLSPKRLLFVLTIFAYRAEPT